MYELGEGRGHNSVHHTERLERTQDLYLEGTSSISFVLLGQITAISLSISFLTY